MSVETLGPNLLFILGLRTIGSETQVDQTLEGLKPQELLFEMSCHALKDVARALKDVAVAPTFRSGQGKKTTKPPRGFSHFPASG
jgi:hypothetical protein